MKQKKILKQILQKIKLMKQNKRKKTMTLLNLKQQRNNFNFIIDFSLVVRFVFLCVIFGIVRKRSSTPNTITTKDYFKFQTKPDNCGGGG